MKRWILILLLVLGMSVPVHAAELSPPKAPEQVQELMPAETESFGEGLWFVLTSALKALEPELAACCGVCLSVMAAVMLSSMLSSVPGMTRSVADLVSAMAIAILLFGGSRTLISAATDAVKTLSEYGKQLLPVMTAAVAAQGGVTASAALYAGTAMFNALLGTVIGSLLTPLVSIYLALSVANAALGDDLLSKLRDFGKWLVTWSLKTILYVFTGYMTVTGVISGTADQAAVKAAKLTISGAVPVVGGILSDASETILVSAGLVKSAVGIYGLLALVAIVIGPFFRIALQYLLLKLTAGISGVLASKTITGLIQDFSGAMGLLLAMTGAQTLLLIISTVCLMKGVRG